MGYHVEEYVVPKAGADLRVPLGKWNKDSGEVTSQLGQVKKASGKVPGPGQYLGHTDWADTRKQGSRRVHETTQGFGYKFPSGEQGKLNFINKVPPPGHYEKKEVSKELSLAASHIVKPRTLFGKCATGPKRSFLDNAVAMGGRTPAPGKYNIEKLRNELDGHITSPTTFRGKKDPAKATAKPKATPGPGSYDIKHAPVEEHHPQWSTSKCKTLSFADRQAKMKGFVPPPDKYDTVKLEKVSRGTKWGQINGRSRSALHGTY
eukprot:CAMPEP_0204340376 /NCGR_PEP_ID=MMETSP0469-20131031/22532_1 /ASSEMBLY_ACC=CAM_ASM_000384 /TAXON_ID=2969 /ORGANISM="Oxyrrhis marina" /LENGTH=261 /DNA_ID=CAMNT_0051324895 /DNA_START=11 /DNA_END=799 /DNA_ORIENTATION=+